MELNLAIANICDGRGTLYKTLDASFIAKQSLTNGI